ncbi:MAG TPA: phage holin family protein [Flavihumibacter sp.]|nr:phage holin family protein [Bacteroidota bacterium]HOA38471.1 phage holin family protein [Flavihumibacter sp.]HPZ87709.1 phage holin family protein [Flavihumibacter sp.]HQD08388.1 phage holin family protein [Flavihumibacter sp.]
MHILIKIIITALVAFGLAHILSGVHIDSFITALIVAVVLAILDAFVKPIMVILTLPVTILTLGLFLLVINSLIILLCTRLVKGFSVDGFWWALLFSILLSIGSSILYSAGAERKSS